MKLLVAIDDENVSTSEEDQEGQSSYIVESSQRSSSLTTNASEAAAAYSDESLTEASPSSSLLREVIFYDAGHPIVDDGSSQVGGGYSSDSTASPEAVNEPMSDNEEADDAADEAALEGTRPAGIRFTVANCIQQMVAYFRVIGRRMLLRVNVPPSPTINPVLWLERSIMDIHAYLLSLAGSGTDMIGVSLSSNHFALGSAGLSYRLVDNFFYEDLWNLIRGLGQSNASFEIDNSFTLEVTLVEMPVGAGRKNNLTVDTVGQRSIVNIVNTDNLCLPRALVVAEVHLRLKQNNSEAMQTEWTIIRDGRRQLQRERAEILCRESAVRVPNNGCGLQELQRFQDYYARQNIGLVAFEIDRLGNGDPPFFDGRNQIDHLTATIFLLHSDTHYDLILNIFGAAKAKFFCSYCNCGYKNIEDHKCAQICSRCFVAPRCDENEAIVECNECKRQFYGPVCFENHKRPGSYKAGNKRLCEALYICPVCCKCVNTTRGKHECGKNWCKICKSKHNYNDHCFIQPIECNFASSSRENGAQVREKKYLYIFYDFETRQDTAYRGDINIKLHVPNLCVAQLVCSYCIGQNTDDNDDNEDELLWCDSCGVREHIFFEDPVKQLLQLAVREKSGFDEIICIAHNARSFDAQFVLRELAEQKSKISPSVILNGKNIISMKYGRTKFIDSLNYFQMKLSDLPATFGLGECNKKGIFPHLFNTVENQNYVGPLPDATFYSPDTMSTKERDNFYSWYREMTNINAIFDFRKEIVEYCRMDVTILRRACIAFRKIFLKVGNTEPFVVATTIASACSHLFRKNFLKKDTIGIVPVKGYRRADTQSQKAIEWLVQCEREIGREIIHAGRAREYRLEGNLMVDGFLPPANPNEKGLVFEYQGCYTHGCPVCFKNKRNKITARGSTFNQLFESTRAKMARIQELGYDTREIWECEFDRVKRENPDIARYVREHPLTSKITLNPRDAFFGGRTENFVAMYDVKENECVKYIDICSLYPYVCKRGRFPIGHPKIYVGSECDQLTEGVNNNFAGIEGLVKCSVVAPRDLFIPLLPVKMHGKLMFALCRTCCEEMRQEVECNHENAVDREFTGTWVADEIRKAIDLGYSVTAIFVIWQYRMTELDPSTGEGGLFSEYIDTFLRLKQQASGFPAWCVDDAKKERYIREYQEKEGVLLEREKIVKNAGLRSVSKISLNSFWGKFGQRSNLKQTNVIKKREDLLKLLIAEDKEVLNVLIVNEELLYVNWQLIDDAVEPTPYTSVVIAAYTTAQARLKLYTYLEKLGRRTLYCDTDSCIFVSREDSDEYSPPLGSLLGEMTDELGEGTVIKSFVSGGPKFYGYRTHTAATGEVTECCKVKGISLNFNNSLKINYNSIRDMLIKYFDERERDDNNEDCNIKLKFNAIRRMPDHSVVTRNEMKTCSIVLKKRRYVSRGLSLPYGYKS